jgi:hypothetical protein
MSPQSKQIKVPAFQHYFVDNVSKKVSQWHVEFGIGRIDIQDCCGQMKFSVKFPGELFWTFMKLPTIYGDYSTCSGAEITTKHITMSVYVHEFKNPDTPCEGTLDIVTDITTNSISIPYRLALNMIAFMGGSTNLESPCY